MKRPGKPATASLIYALLATSLGAAAWSAHADPATPSVSATSPVDAGRYLIIIGGCNDCHTPNWAETGGTLAEENWLVGSPLGWRGPWGTTYPSNLRLLAGQLTEDAWVAMLQTRVVRPQMPWMNVNRLSEQDSRAIYRYIRSLGSAGDPMPVAVDNLTEPATAYILMEPIAPERGSTTPKSAATQ